MSVETQMPLFFFFLVEQMPFKKYALIIQYIYALPNDNIQSTLTQIMS